MCRWKVIVRGGGDLGSGVALRLWRCGMRVIVLETAAPMAVRRTVAFSEAVYDGATQVEEAIGRLTPLTELDWTPVRADIPVSVDPDAVSLERLEPDVVVDAIMAKRNTGTRLDMAPNVVAMGPGFVAGRDVTAVVETNRGPNLGRVLWSGAAEPNTGEPGEVGKHTSDRVLRAPSRGVLHNLAEIGDIVDEGASIAEVDGSLITSPFRSLVRGLARDGLHVRAGMKVGDIDPRLDPSLCTLVSDKALAVAGGVLEAILSLRGNV